MKRKSPRIGHETPNDIHSHNVWKRNLGVTVHCPGGRKARESQQRLVGKGESRGHLRGHRKEEGLDQLLRWAPGSQFQISTWPGNHNGCPTSSPNRWESVTSSKEIVKQNSTSYSKKHDILTPCPSAGHTSKGNITEIQVIQKQKGGWGEKPDLQIAVLDQMKENTNLY